MAIIVTGTGFCDKNIWYNGNNPAYSPVVMADGIRDGKRWIGAAVNSVASLQNFGGVKFTGLQDIKEIVISFASWGNSIRIGTWANGVDPAGASFTKANIIPLQSYTAIGQTDSDGKAIAINTDLRLLIDAVQIPGFILYCDSNATSQMTNTPGSPNTNLSINEITTYGRVLTVNDGSNPKPPATVPVAPFSATPTDWTRTEFSTAGAFDFTPAADTTLVLAIIQGAGSGGQILKNLDATDTAFGTVNEGADSWISSPAGNVFSRAGGGKGIVAGATSSVSEISSNDWLRYLYTAGAIGNTNVAPSQAALTGAAQTRIGGTAGATYSLSGMTGPNLGNVNFATDISETLVPTNLVTNWARNNTLGWYSTNVGQHGTTAVLQFQPIALEAGQAVTLTYYASSEPTDRIAIYFNGTRTVFTGAVSSQDYTYTAPSKASYTIRVEFIKDASGSQSLDRAGITALKVSGAQFPLQRSGASGSNVTHFITPQPLKLRVGAAGVGVSGGQTVPTGAKGTRGAGGAAGADGGAGVIVIYEFKNSVVFEKPIVPLFPNYNNMTVEPVGIYRMNYIGQGLGTKQNYSHKLRPRTKYVYVIAVGAGGGTVNTYTPPSTAVPNDPAIVSAGAKTFTAGSGSSSYRTNAGSNSYPCQGGEGGVFSANAETLYQTNGQGSRNNASQNLSGVVNNYGNSGGGVNGAGDGINNSAYPGGAGAVLMFVLSGDDIASGTIDIQVPGGGRAPASGQYDVGNPGAVFIFETEQGLGYATTQTSELILTKSAIPATQVTQTAELILQKSQKEPIRTTQVSELILVKDTTAIDMQVANVYATVVFDAPPTGMNITQTAELVLQKNSVGGTAVTQTAEMVLQKTARSPYRLTQVSELFLVAETPTIFWLNFGTLENPVRFQLYDSAIGRASSVPPNCKIQIEGFFAEGTHLVINGVASGILANVTNNDRVYINGGVTNYWQSNIPVYAYYEENGETARMLVGNWIIKQPELIPLVTKTYYGSKVTPTWIKTRAGVGSTVALQSILTKAFISLVQLTMTAVQNKFGSMVDLLQEKTGANSRIAEVTMGWDITKALSKVSDTVDWSWTQALSVDVKNVITWGTLKAHTTEFKQADFIDTKAAYGDVETDYEVLTGGSTGYVVTSESVLLSVNYGHFESDTEQTQAGYGDYVVEDFDKTSVAYDEVDQEYEYNNVDHSVHYTVVYVAVQSSSVARLFSMEPMGTIAYSVLTATLWDRSVAQGTGHWLIPLSTADNPKAKFGVFSVEGVDSRSGHSEYSERETEVINGPQQGFYGTTSLWRQTYAVHSERSVIKHTEKVEVFDVTPIKTTAKTGVFNLPPFIAKQSINTIGKASLYKGFDTKAEVDAFTENFGGVHTALKYNGYVYTLDVDKSFICEIFNNGPVKWLLQGG